MKMVSLDILSETATLADLSKALGVDASHGSSHERGSARPLHRVWEKTVWRLESDVAENAPLSQHIENILQRVSTVKLSGALPHDCTVYLNIGVTFETAMCSIEIPPASLQLLSKAGIRLLVNCYPSSSPE